MLVVADGKVIWMMMETMIQMMTVTTQVAEASSMPDDRLRAAAAEVGTTAAAHRQMAMAMIAPVEMPVMLPMPEPVGT